MPTDKDKAEPKAAPKRSYVALTNILHGVGTKVFRYEKDQTIPEEHAREMIEGVHYIIR